MMTISTAEEADLQDILEFQHKAYVSEANLYNDFHIQSIRQTYEEIVTEFESSIFFEGDNKSCNCRICKSEKAGRNLPYRKDRRSKKTISEDSGHVREPYRNEEPKK